MDTTEVQAAIRRADELTISELFGPTLQGEGKSQGKPAMFLRLGLCNLDCAWCDTSYTWDWTGKNGTVYDREKELSRVTIAQLIEQLPASPDRLIITGGEPMLQQRKLVWLINGLYERNPNYKVEIETNGTLAPSALFDPLSVQFTVSPKLSNSWTNMLRALNFDVLRVYAEAGAVFKFVVNSDACIAEVRKMQQLLEIPRERIWLMPEGKTTDQILKRLPWLFDLCSELKYNLSPRLHVLAHNDKRGI